MQDHQEFQYRQNLQQALPTLLQILYLMSAHQEHQHPQILPSRLRLMQDHQEFQ
jgi:hypothetical protein